MKMDKDKDDHCKFMQIRIITKIKDIYNLVC